MRNILLILLFISSISFAQTGINYQGAATDSQGNKLENQNISLRTSVLQGGVDGTTSYSETHNTTTDQFGLFNVVIGQGEVVSGDFDSISWGADAHFLKVELDATGGSDYSLVSTTQMMSVPYALYAENAGIDSAMVADMIANSGINGSLKSYKYPEGINGEPVVIDLHNSNYIVPNGKNLYISTSYHSGPDLEITINGLEVFLSSQSPLGNNSANMPIILKSGDILSHNGNPSFVNIMGMLIDQQNIDPIVIDLLFNDYEVPNGKNLYISSSYHGGPFPEITINDLKVFKSYEGSLAQITSNSPIILKSGDILSYEGFPSSINISGYLADEDYFENLGGGGNSDVQMTVSTFGDTLTIGDQSVIVPGLSSQNPVASMFGSVTDFDGNTYQTVKIYGQEWMAEDLKNTTFSNGEVITQFEWWDNNNDEESAYRNSGPKIYYNGFAVIDQRNICPTGWHVPTVADFTEMLNFFGTFNEISLIWEGAGSALKSTDPYTWSQYFLNNNSSFLNILNDGYLLSGSSGTVGNDAAFLYAFDEKYEGSGHAKIKLDDNQNSANLEDASNYPSKNFLKVRCVKD